MNYIFIKSFLHLPLLLIFTLVSYAQVPTISGDNLLCPESVGQAMTQEFDSYQWYIRYFGSTETSILEGDTNQVLMMPYFDFAASYVSVEVTSGGDTLLSEEFFVDGWAFAPATVATSGDFEIIGDGDLGLCPGDTLFFQLNNPYNTNITWFKDGEPIPDAVDQIIAVTETGTYYVEGAPEVCPEFIQGPGVPLNVVNCSTTNIHEKNIGIGVLAYPNPAGTRIWVDLPETLEATSYQITNLNGQPVASGVAIDLRAGLDVSNLNSGVYLLQLTETGQVIRFVKI